MRYRREESLSRNYFNFPLFEIISQDFTRRFFHRPLILLGKIVLEVGLSEEYKIRRMDLTPLLEKYKD